MPFKLKIIYTGGTLGMQQGKQGLVPAPYLANRFEDTLNTSTFYRTRLASIEWQVFENQPLLDSANIRPPDWESIADQCRTTPGFDAVVIIHGTDTLAYSASALAFLLQDISIPVVVTGAQKPMGTPHGDALDNLAGAMLETKNVRSGVWVYFHRQMMPAARVVKKDAISYTGFEAPRLRSSPTTEPRTAIGWQTQTVDWSELHIACAYMVPGYRADHLHALIACNPSAIILSLYGRGTFADHNQALLDEIKLALDSGILVAAVSQCYIGDIDFGLYDTGAALERLGVLNGHDITLEAAYTKLLVLFHMGYPADQIKQLFVQNIANELSKPDL